LKRSNRLILLIGVFLAALAFVFIIVLLSGGTGTPGTGGNPSAAPTTSKTVVAAKDIPLGVAVTADMLTTKTLDNTVRLPGVFGDPSQAVGQVARQNIKRDQQVTLALFTDIGQSSRVDCPSGFTCIAVQVDQVSGVGTLVKTGDYVDVVAQLSTTAGFPVNYFVDQSKTPTSGDTGAKYDPASVKMLIQGLQVVATLLPPPPAAETGTTGGAAASAPPTTGGTTALNGQQEIVIIAVTAQQAEVVKFAQVDGNITLSLRSPKDFVDENNVPIVPPTVDTTGLTLQEAIKSWGVLPPLPVIVPQPVPAR
jgi:Flp pilus assembly protein CpaB